LLQISYQNDVGDFIYFEFETAANEYLAVGKFLVGLSLTVSLEKSSLDIIDKAPPGTEPPPKYP
jgi:hypothetical protein